MIRHQLRSLPGHSSLGFLLLASLTACSQAADTSRASNGEPSAPPQPNQETPSARPTKQAWLLSTNEAPVPLVAFSIESPSSELRQSLEQNGCADIITGAGAGSVGQVTIESGATITADFYTWAAGELAGPRRNQPAARAGIQIAVGDVDSSCVVEVATPRLDRLALRTPAGSTPRLAWVASGATTAKPGAGRSIGGTSIGSVTSEPTTAALLVPAVQKIAMPPLPPASSTADGYPLFVAGGAAPPPFEVSLSEEDARVLFPEGSKSTSTPKSILELAGPHGSLALVLPMEEITLNGTAMRAKPRTATVLLAPAAVPDATRLALLASLRSAAPEALDETTAPRLLALLDGRPQTTGDLLARRRTTTDYWTAAGRRTALDTGLATLLACSSDEEGLWAYTRLMSTARLFAELDPQAGAIAVPSLIRSRGLAAAALHDLEDASFPMWAPMTTRTNAPAHDYSLAFAAVTRLADASSLLLSAPPHALKGVEPDEIDVAVAADTERAPSTRVVDDAASRLRATMDTVVGPTTITDADLTRLEDEASALRDLIAKLQNVMALRFETSRAL